MCLAQGPQSSDAGEAQTCDPSVSSQALYHWATVLPKHLELILQEIDKIFPARDDWYLTEEVVTDCICISTQERQVGKEKENNVSTTINYTQLATIMLMQ